MTNGPYGRARAALTTADALIDAAAPVVLAYGLRQRADHGRLHPPELATYRHLLGLGALMPDGLAVCEVCHLVVSVTGRKRGAKRCDRCHARSRPVYPRGMSEPSTSTVLVTRDDQTFHQVTGAPVGWHRSYYIKCAGCDRSFWTGRRNTRTCSPRCRVRAAREKTGTRVPSRHE
jgi:hypothetical protein